MKSLYILLLLPIAVFCSGVSLPPQPPTNGTITPPPTPSHNTTASSPPTSSTTVNPNSTTTTAKTTTSSTTISTTTVAPTTTPPPPPTTTTTANPNSTTVVPITTPSPNTTTPAPAPSPPPPQPAAGSWTVKNETSNVTCVMVNMAISINVTYSKTDNKTGFAILNVPKNASANGTCHSEKQKLELDWDNGQNVLEMVFEKNTTEKKFVVHDIKLMLSVNPNDFPNATEGVTNLTFYHNHSLFATSLTRSYRCMKSQEINLFTENHNETVGMLTVSKVQLEAFHETNSTDFGAIEDCERSTDIVPITVGCALVGLVAVVLIGYLVGRRRSQARGYLSM